LEHLNDRSYSRYVNANSQRHYCEALARRYPASKLKLEIARILKEEGYINNFVIKGEGLKRTIRIFLRYDSRGTSSITHLQRVSTPGRRVYVGSNEIPKVLGGYGINIVSTSKGLMSGKAARRENVGGELLAQIY